MIDKRSMEYAQGLVGEISENNLQYVDCYIGEHLGIFIPTVGFCEYAIKPQHSHPAYSFILYFSEEHSTMPLTVEMTPNHYLVMAIAPEIKHEESTLNGFTRYIAIFISYEFYEKFYSMYDRNGKPDSYLWKQFLVNKDIMVYINRFMSEFENRTLGYQSIMESLSDIICHQLIRSVLNITDRLEVGIERLEIEKVVAYMHQNFSDKITIKSLAQLVNMSPSHFIRIFKEETGFAPIEYLIKIRVDKGKKLLRSRTKTISEIALQCGFNSTSHFSTCFIKQHGSTPTDYQNLF